MMHTVWAANKHLFGFLSLYWANLSAVANWSELEPFRNTSLWVVWVCYSSAPLCQWRNAISHGVHPPPLSLPPSDDHRLLCQWQRLSVFTTQKICKQANGDCSYPHTYMHTRSAVSGETFSEIRHQEAYCTSFSLSFPLSLYNLIYNQKPQTCK